MSGGDELLGAGRPARVLGGTLGERDVVRADAGAGELDLAGAVLEAAEKAKASCPISKALTGVDITLDAALEG